MSMSLIDISNRTELDQYVGPLANLVERLAKQNILLARIWQPITSCKLWQLPILSSSSAMLRKQHHSCFRLKNEGLRAYGLLAVRLVVCDWEQPNWWPLRPKSPACQKCHLVLEGPFGDVRNLRGTYQKCAKKTEVWECMRMLGSWSASGVSK